ncbi:MAG TPA: thioredoxin, partial [Rhodobacteraceae bacterium]|nr:thioredoxin [Paracoccaceae bacterium]
MRYLLSVILYTALAATANADMSALEALRAGDMRKLQFHNEITNAPQISFVQDNG